MINQKSFLGLAIFLLMMISSSSGREMSDISFESRNPNLVLSEASGKIEMIQERNPKPSSRSNEDVESLFKEWLIEHDKAYDSQDEKQKRFEIFKDTLEFIDEHNAKNGGHGAKLNQFADLTMNEFESIYLSNDFSDESKYSNVSFHDESTLGDLQDLPNYVDWRDHGAVTPVKSQKSCECCWVFSGIASVESLNKIVRGKLYRLSEQQIIDCEGHGAEWGTVDAVYRYIIRNGGIDTDDDYSYIGQKERCDLSRVRRRMVRIDSYNRLIQTEIVLQRAVSRRPVSVAVAASSPEFKHYDGFGVFKNNCGTKLNHAVLVIGYGTTEEGEDYWLIKNSWGTKWGDNGFMRLQRNTRFTYGKCQITRQAFYPVITRRTNQTEPYQSY